MNRKLLFCLVQTSVFFFFVLCVMCHFSQKESYPHLLNPLIAALSATFVQFYLKKAAPWISNSVVFAMNIGSTLLAAVMAWLTLYGLPYLWGSN